MTSTLTLKFESCDCSRCGGSGRMPFSAYGGVCFKCNGAGQVLTPAGRSARKLYDTLLSAACTTKQAWEVEVGERVTYAHEVGVGARWFTVVEKEFTSTSGSVVDGRCLGSAVLKSAKVGHMATPDTLMAVYPGVEVKREIIAEVAKRRKGAVVVAAQAA